jgi:hypothetical protein
LDEKQLSQIAVSPRTDGEVHNQRERQGETDVQEDVVPSRLWVRDMACRVSTQQDQGRAHISRLRGLTAALDEKQQLMDYRDGQTGA